MNEDTQTNLVPLPAPPDSDLLLQGPPEVDLSPDHVETLRRSARSKLTLLTDKAVRTLDKGLDSKDLKVALTAAKDILDRDGVAAPKSILLDDTSGFSSSVLLGLLSGAAKVMGLPVDEAAVNRTLMEAKVSKDEASFTVATESIPQPKANTHGAKNNRSEERNVTPPTAKPGPKRKAAPKKKDTPISIAPEYPPEFLSALTSGGK